MEIFEKLRTPLRWWLGAMLCMAGVGHFVFADFFMEIMPDWIPFHEACVYLSGIAEIALGIGLQLPRVRTFAAWGTLALLVAVYPVNINMALSGQTHIAALPEAMQPTQLALWMRLPLQFAFGLLAYWYTRPAAVEVSLRR